MNIIGQGICDCLKRSMIFTLDSLSGCASTPISKL